MSRSITKIDPIPEIRNSVLFYGYRLPYILAVIICLTCLGFIWYGGVHGDDNASPLIHVSSVTTFFVFFLFVLYPILARSTFELPEWAAFDLFRLGELRLQYNLDRGKTPAGRKNYDDENHKDVAFKNSIRMVDDILKTYRGDRTNIDQLSNNISNLLVKNKNERAAYKKAIESTNHAKGFF